VGGEQSAFKKNNPRSSPKLGPGGNKSGGGGISGKKPPPTTPPNNPVYGRGEEKEEAWGQWGGRGRNTNPGAQVTLSYLGQRGERNRQGKKEGGGEWGAPWEGIQPELDKN